MAFRIQYGSREVIVPLSKLIQGLAKTLRVPVPFVLHTESSSPYAGMQPLTQEFSNFLGLMLANEANEPCYPTVFTFDAPPAFRSQLTWYLRDTYGGAESHSHGKTTTVYTVREQIVISAVLDLFQIEHEYKFLQ